MAAGEAAVLSGASTVDHVPASDIEAGEVVDIGVFAIAQTKIVAGTLGTLNRGPMQCEVTKATGAGTDFAVGTHLYWDASAGAVTETAGSNLYIGPVTKVPAEADTFVQIHATGQAVLA